MQEYLGDDSKKGLLHLVTLDGTERKRFLRALVNTATKDLAFIDPPECPTPQHAALQSAVLTFFTVATKHSIHNDDLRNYLTESLKIQNTTAEDLLESYNSCKDDIRTKLAKYGHDIPWVTNVNWKLSSVLRSSGQDEMKADLIYKITFEGTSPTGQRSVVTNFECTLEELQNLSSKFKEIERSCHRISAINK